MSNQPLLKQASAESVSKCGKSMTTKADFEKNWQTNLPGVLYGLTFPISADQIKSNEFGAGWLTKAFRASGVIPSTVTVSEVVSCVDITGDVGGGAGNKAILELKYEGNWGAAAKQPTKFFVKIPAADKSDRYRAASMNAAGPEIGFGHLFCSPIKQASSFPQRVTKMYFADINLESSNFIEIQEALTFADGEKPGALFPAYPKLKDWSIDQALVEEFYPLLAKSLAQQCAWYETIKTSSVGEELRSVFKYNNLFDNVPSSCHCLLRPLLYWVGRSLFFFSVNFIKQVPNLCPPEILKKDFLKQYQREVEECLYMLPEILMELKGTPDKPGNVCYGHPNLCMDNVFFYRGQDGKEIKCGGLDFGGYGGTTPVVLLSGAIGGMDDDKYVKSANDHFRLFCREYTSSSGLPLPEEQVVRDMALIEVFNCLVCFASGAIEVFKYCSLKQLQECSSMRDGIVVDNFYARCFTRMGIQTYTRFTNQKTYEHMQKWRKEKNIAGPGVSSYLLYWLWNPFHTCFMKTQVCLYNMGLLKYTWGLGTLAVLGGAVYGGLHKFGYA